MKSEEFVGLMKKVDEIGLDWTEIEKKLDVPKQLLDLYARSGPVPVTIIKKLNQIIEEAQNN